MAEPSYASSTLADAASVPGATVGAAVTLGAEDTIDLSRWAKRWVKIYSLDDGALFSFQALGDTTPLDTGVAPVGTPAVPDAVDAGAGGIHRLIPEASPQLRHVALGAGGILRIIPS